MIGNRKWSSWWAAGVGMIAGTVLGPGASHAHPLGNFSISHYARIRVESAAIELRYVIDMAEIPTFQEIQETGIVPESGHPSLDGYLAGKAEALKAGLRLELNGRPLALVSESRHILFTPGAGGLPTMKLGLTYRARLDGPPSAGLRQLLYSDENFPDRAGWKEVVAVTGPGVVLAQSSVPEADRSRELADYPTDLLNSPPQVLEARVVFGLEPSSRAETSPDAPEPPSTAPRPAPTDARPSAAAAARSSAATGPRPAALADTGSRRHPRSTGDVRHGPSSSGPSVDSNDASRTAGRGIDQIALRPNRQPTPRDAFTELVAGRPAGLGMILFAVVVAVTLGAVHALEPGHGKTIVAAYLVGSRGTAFHAVLLGLLVTASHTAGVYLLGGVTLYASRYVVPDRLYPWLGAASGLIIAGLGLALFLRRYAGHASPHGHAHARGSSHSHVHAADGDHSHAHAHGQAHDAAGSGHAHGSHETAVSIRELVALGVTGGIVPCPAALVVLLSAVVLRRVGFGLLLIAAFSAGLAAVLIAIGLLMVYARRLMARFRGDGPLFTRWLPLTSSVAVTVLGFAIAIRALVSAGILQVRLG
jgi:ABC-type nickel/cobalt efflux system permease component RcnA